MTGPFRAGDRVQLTGHKGRRNTITLAAGGVFHTHRGTLAHDLLIGEPDGSVVTGSDGQHYLALKPLLTDYVMSMPRGAAIVYPKDAGQIIASADIALGQRVVEAGVGSGALTLWLLRAVGETGTVHSVERRQEFADVAADNVAGFFEGTPDRWTLTTGDLAEVLDAGEPAVADRVVLDMLAPWETVARRGARARARRRGDRLHRDGAAALPGRRGAPRLAARSPSRCPPRPWSAAGTSTASPSGPTTAWSAHTGFLVTARRLADGAIAPRTSRRAPKTFSDEDVELWTPGAIGEREKSPKRIRKVARQAAEIADARAAGRDRTTDPDGPVLNLAGSFPVHRTARLLAGCAVVASLAAALTGCAGGAAGVAGCTPQAQSGQASESVHGDREVRRRADGLLRHADPRLDDRGQRDHCRATARRSPPPRRCRPRSPSSTPPPARSC